MFKCKLKATEEKYLKILTLAEDAEKKASEAKKSLEGQRAVVEELQEKVMGSDANCSCLKNTLKNCRQRRLVFGPHALRLTRRALRRPCDKLFFYLS